VTRYLTLDEVLELQRRVIAQFGGAKGVRDLGALESAVAQPHMSFSGQECYPTLVDKASALAFSLVMNHPFVDGNKRIGHAAMEAFLLLNGLEIVADTDDQEKVFLALASGSADRQVFTEWVRSHVAKRAQ
jgi:death-on-curing protein